MFARLADCWALAPGSQATMLPCGSAIGSAATPPTLAATVPPDGSRA
ncbi:MAG TPA: hypothetical protein VL738_19130 [Dactylosporangium sp.]|nr:hypothetical protein [Dactylosporangium sp.]